MINNMAMTPLHAAVGIGIVSAIPNPLFSLPLAFLSHIWLDFYPEWYAGVSGINQENEYNIRKYDWKTKILVLVQVLLGIGVLLFLIIQNNIYFWLAALLANLMDITEAISVIFFKRKFWFFHGGNFPFKITIPWQCFGMLPIQNAALDLNFVVIILIACWK